MRIWGMIAAVALVASCGSKKDTTNAGPGSASNAPPAKTDDAALQVPIVGAAQARPALATSYVRVDRDGTIAMGDVPAAARKGDAIDLDALGAGTKVSVAELRAKLHPPGDPEDPPVPPPDTDDDVPIGSGEAMALDEGKMGRKDTHRSEGQYKMKDNDVDQVQLARQQAIAEARHAGILGNLATKNGAAFASITGTGAPQPAESRDLDAYPLDKDGGVDAAPSAPIIVADARAPAHALIDALRANDGVATIAVRAQPGDPARALAVAFGIVPHADALGVVSADGPPDTELVVALGADATLTVQQGTKKVVTPLTWQGAADGAAIAAAYGKARADAMWTDRDDVRLVVDDKATVGTMVAALAALADKGAYTIHVGPPHDPPAATEPPIDLALPSTVGDLDKEVIRKYIRRNLAKIQYCYEKRLLDIPALKGTVTVSFFISPSGTVAEAQASGVDGQVSACIADVVKTIEFPKPKGGGGVQVTYPFTFSSKP